MSLFELFIIAVGLSMDAFAVAVCKGLSMKTMDKRKAVIIGTYFGGFQAFMPLIGYLVGARFEQKISFIDHWIAFFLLCFIGGNMIREALSREEEEVNDSINVKEMFVLSVATSIDALVVGITFACLGIHNIEFGIGFIGVTTFFLAMVGVKVGNVFGKKYKNKAEFVGGMILILMGLKILLEHLGIIG